MDTKKKVVSISEGDFSYVDGKNTAQNVEEKASNDDLKSNSKLKNTGTKKKKLKIIEPEDIDMNENELAKKLKYFCIFLLGIVAAIAILSMFGGVNGSSKNLYGDIKIHDEGISAAVKKIYNATVYIENYKNGKVYSSGTGFVYKKNAKIAYILTNYHVINGNTSLKVTYYDDSVVDASFVGGDQYADVAVISVPSSSIKQVASIGSSSDALLGDTVFTVGSPVGDEYRGTVTRGILSGKDRMVSVSVGGGADDYVMKLLQTDAAMNPGNSGGPLCNANGEVIGMNSLKLVKNEVEGMGFSISIEDIMNYSSSFEKKVKIERPYIGIAMVNLEDSDALSHYGLTDKVNKKLTKGVVIENVEDGSAAFGKINSGDVILKLNGVKVDNMAYLRYELYKHKVGDTVTLSVDRQGKMIQIKVVLGVKKSK